MAIKGLNPLEKTGASYLVSLVALLPQSPFNQNDEWSILTFNVVFKLAFGGRVVSGQDHQK